MSAGPFAEVDDAAAIAAEGEICVGTQDYFAAGWTTEGIGFVLGHGKTVISVQLPVISKVKIENRCAMMATLLDEFGD